MSDIYLFVCSSSASKVLLISMSQYQVLIETDMHQISTEVNCMNSQLRAAAINGKAADVDRLIKDGANTEAQTAVRAQCLCQCRGQRLFPLR